MPIPANSCIYSKRDHHIVPDNLISGFRANAGGTATWTDQAPVRAALHGRVLILDGMEKVAHSSLSSPPS